MGPLSGLALAPPALTLGRGPRASEWFREIRGTVSGGAAPGLPFVMVEVVVVPGTARWLTELGLGAEELLKVESGCDWKRQSGVALLRSSMVDNTDRGRESRSSSSFKKGDPGT